MNTEPNKKKDYYVEEAHNAKAFEATLEDIVSDFRNGKLEDWRTVRMTVDGEYKWSTVGELCKNERLKKPVTTQPEGGQDAKIEEFRKGFKTSAEDNQRTIGSDNNIIRFCSFAGAVILFIVSIADPRQGKTTLGTFVFSVTGGALGHFVGRFIVWIGRK